MAINKVHQKGSLYYCNPALVIEDYPIVLRHATTRVLAGWHVSAGYHGILQKNATRPMRLA